RDYFEAKKAAEKKAEVSAAPSAPDCTHEGQPCSYFFLQPGEDKTLFLRKFGNTVPQIEYDHWYAGRLRIEHPDKFPDHICPGDWRAARPRSLRQESPTAWAAVIACRRGPGQVRDKASAGRPPIHTAMMAAKL